MQKKIWNRAVGAAAAAVLAATQAAPLTGLTALAADDEYVYGTVNLPYADYYYGELYDVEANAEMDLTAEDPAAAIRAEGYYDAVTSATNQKSTRYGTTYYTENEDGSVTVEGIKDVAIAVPQSLYEEATAAIEAGSACSNQLLNIIGSMTVNEDQTTVPAEYKMLNGDGTLCAMTDSAEAIVVEDATVTISTNTTYGNYQIDIAEADAENSVLPTSENMEGVVITTTDGAKYAMLHVDNLWLRTGEIAWAIEDGYVVHSVNTLKYLNFVDMERKTITSIQYIIRGGRDVIYKTESYLPVLHDGTVTADSVAAASGKIEVTYADLPEDYEPTAEIAELSTTYSDGVLTYDADGVLPGSYTITVTDESGVYASISTAVTLTTDEMPAAFDAETNTIVAAEGADEVMFANYLSNLSTATVNDTTYKLSGRGSTKVIDITTGAVNLEVTSGDAAVFGEDGTYTVVVSSTGYADLTFEIVVGGSDVTGLVVSVPENLADGTYTGTATVEPDENEEFNFYPISVDVLIQEGTVVSFTVTGATGSNVQYSERAEEGINEQIAGNEAGSYEIDAVSMATCSSYAIVDGLNHAFASDPVSTVITLDSKDGYIDYNPEGSVFSVTIENPQEDVDYSEIVLSYATGKFSDSLTEDEDYKVELLSETEDEIVYQVTVLPNDYTIDDDDITHSGNYNSIGQNLDVTVAGTSAGRVIIRSTAEVSINNNTLLLIGGNGETLASYIEQIDEVTVSYDEDGETVTDSYTTRWAHDVEPPFTGDQLFLEDGSINFDLTYESTDEDGNTIEVAVFANGSAGTYVLNVTAGDGFAGASATIGTVVNSDTDYVYGTVNLPYADYYYGELYDVEANAEMNLTAEDPAASIRAEGMYDAVTSATNQKSTQYGTTYYTENEDGSVTVEGIKDVAIAVPQSLYEEATAAIEANSACSNQLLNIISSMTVNEDQTAVPAEYKVLNGDGTLCAMTDSAEAIVVEDATVTISTNTTYGNYQIDIAEADAENSVLPTSENMEGVVISTTDGAKYAMLHVDNLWLRTGEIAWAIKDNFVVHSVNTLKYQSFADMEGKTISEVRYIVRDGADVVFPTELLCKNMLPEDASISGENTVFADGAEIAMTLNVPTDSTYTLDSVIFNKTDLTAGTDYTYDTKTNVLTILETENTGIGSYSLTYVDDVYADISTAVEFTSAMTAEQISITDNKLVIDEAAGVSIGEYLAAVTGISINGTALRGSNLGTVVFNEDGSVNFAAEVSFHGNVTAVFADTDSNEYTIEITAAGYPSVSGTVTNTSDPSIELGDVNQNGKIDMYDAYNVLIYSSNLSLGNKDYTFCDDAELEAALVEAADVDGSGTIDMYDAYFILVYSSYVSLGTTPEWSDVIK